jgi:hypothetical protein
LRFRFSLVYCFGFNSSGHAHFFSQGMTAGGVCGSGLPPGSQKVSQQSTARKYFHHDATALDTPGSSFMNSPRVGKLSSLQSLRLLRFVGGLS